MFIPNDEARLHEEYEKRSPELQKEECAFCFDEFYIDQMNHVDYGEKKVLVCEDCETMYYEKFVGVKK